MFLLQVTRGPDQGKKLQLEPGKTYTVGCNPDASLVLTDPLVLKGHCSLEIADATVVLRNHTATAGTFVGDQKISQANLKANGSFRIGGTTLQVAPAPSPATAKPPPAPAPPDPLVGKIIGGYKLKELVGAGGMGKVYRATQLSLHRDVAFKVLRDQHAKDKGFRDLFINEARAAAQLVHPNVVQVYDAGTEGDLVYFSMEFLGQGSTEEILEKEKTIPWEKAILMVLEAAHGLEYAEGKGIVHRDIKPDNLMLNEAGQVKIADLGLAKRGEDTGGQGIIGTPHFIPPEQALGKAVDHRADLYSLGATFFRMITGRTVFSGKTAKEIVLKHIKEPPPAASSLDETVPDDLDLVIAKMLAKEPDNRYQSATEVIAALEEVCAHHGIKGSIIRKGVGKRVLIPLILLLLAAGGTVYYLATKPRSAAEIANEKQLMAAKDAADKAAAELAEKNRQEERKNRRANANARFDKRDRDELTLKLKEPILQVYDDDNTSAAKEALWLALARDFETFAQEPETQEFEAEDELSSKANRHAKDIRESLRQWKESADDLKEKSAAKIVEAKGIDATQRGQLAAFKAARKLEKAAKLCEVIATGKPANRDPFFVPIVSWEWVSPVDAKQRRPWSSFAELKKVVDESRAYFKNAKEDIITEAQKAAETRMKKAESLPPDEADPAAIDESIKELEEIRNFRDDETEEGKIVEIQRLIGQARDLQDILKGAVARRGKGATAADRVAVRDQQRKQSSLDRDQQPNNMMVCEFVKARDAWNRMVVDGQIKTELYQRFARERIAMATWCEFLFARFFTDLVAMDGVNKPFTNLDVAMVPFADGKSIVGAQLTAKGVSDAYKFALNKANAGINSWGYAQFPMDWVHSSIFHLAGGAPRWVEVTPEIRFALGAFCFETMQYADAEKHFDALLHNGDGPYTAAARSLRARAAKEAKARATYEALLRQAAAAKTAAELGAVREKLNQFPAEYDGTLFWLEVMDPARDEMKVDFHPADAVEIPPAPPPPDPRGG